MRGVLVIASRAFGRLASQSTTGFAVCAFLAAVGALFAVGLFAAEGKAISVSSVWAVAVANAMPLLASLLTMRLWSDDGNSERTEIDLVVPVPERAFATGRFLAAFAATAIAIAVSLVVPVAILPRCAPSLSSDVSVARVLPAFAALLIFAVPLTAFGSLASVFFRKAAPAAVASMALTGAVPYAAYHALVAWSPMVRMMFPEPPMEAMIADAADGRFAVGVAASALSLSCFAMFATSKIFALRRLAGAGRFVLKASSALAICSALLAAMLFSLVAHRFDFILEWPGMSKGSSISARTRDILSGISREVHVEACIRRNSPEFLQVSRLLRALAAESRVVAGAGVTCTFVDPRWDPNAASRIARFGGGENTILFAVGRHRIVIPVNDADESMCASAIQRLSLPAKHATVLFTAGHGEPSISDFGPAGLADSVRALKQEGYHVGTLFSATSTIPVDCSVLAVVGAKTRFSAAELKGISMFLAQGGRILATVSSVDGNGIQTLLETSGLSAELTHGKLRTTDGSDIVASMFGDHIVSGPLSGSVVVFAPDSVRLKSEPRSSAREGEGGFAFVPLCMAEDSVLAMAAEKGSALKSDLAIRPARMVVLGDPSFFRNASLSSRANANRDFFLNSVAWLAGLDVSGATGIAGNVMSARMDRSLRIRFAAFSIAGLPMVAGFVWLFVNLLRRRRR